MTKFCPKCGDENEDVAQFCGNCGHDFKDVDKRMKESKRKDSSLNLPGTKILLGIIAIIAIIIIAAFAFSGGNNDEQQNITLIKVNAYGFTFVNDGVPFYNYQLEGVLTNLKGDYQGYDLNARFYDANDSLLKEYHNNYMKYIFANSENSQTNTIVSLQTNEFYNVSYIQLEILDPNGTTVFNDTVDFDMAKMDLSGLKEK